MILPGFQRSTADFIKGKGFAAAGTEPSWIHFDCWGFPKTKRTALVSKKGFLHCNTIAFPSCNGRGKYYDSNALFNVVPCIRYSFGWLVKLWSPNLSASPHTDQGQKSTITWNDSVILVTSDNETKDHERRGSVRHFFLKKNTSSHRTSFEI